VTGAHRSSSGPALPSDSYQVCDSGHNQGVVERHEADASNPWFKKPGGWARGNGPKAAAPRERRDPT